MTVPIDLTRFDFHDASLYEGSQDSSTVILKIKYFDENDLEYFSVTEISGIEDIIESNSKIKEFVMESQQASILTLEKNDREVFLLLQWQLFEPRSRVTRAYHFQGRKIQLQAWLK